MLPKPERYALLAHLCLALGLSARLCILARPVDVLADRYLADDFFYYLNIAFNVANGRGSTFDAGITHTNGYNPMLVGMLTIAFRMHATKESAIRVGLLIEALAIALAAGLATRYCIRNRAFIAAILVAGLVSFSPFFIWPTVNGFETGLAVATAFVALELWDGNAPGVVVGAACGIACLARVDALLLVASLLALRLLQRRWRVAAGIATGFTVTVLPFALWSAYRFGVILPESALQKTHLRSLASIKNSVAIVISTLPAVVISHRVLDHVPVGMLWVLGIGTGVVCALGARRLGPARVLFLLGLAAGYSLMANGFEPGALKRYLFPVWVLCAMSVALAVDGLSAWLATRFPLVDQRFKPAALVAALILLVQAVDCASLLRWDRATKPVASYVGACERLGRELDTVLAKDERVASFDSGSLGYFASRPVVNLDGLVNDDIPRMRSRCLGPYGSCLLRYLHEKRIAILIGGTAFGWTAILPNWTNWSEVYASPPLGDGARVVVLRIPD